MYELLKTFGQTIKAARQAAGLTQEELAEQVGITTRRLPSSINASSFSDVSMKRASVIFPEC